MGSRKEISALRRSVCALALLLVTFGAFLPAINNGFISLDDGPYVTENPVVLLGLSLRGLRWSFTTFAMGNWHPLAWISHMADVTLFGLRAGGHHLTSVLLHVASSVGLFLLLSIATGSLGRSLLAAALFAVHPLRAESVAWVAERKDVLSVFFWVMCLLAYVGYARRPTGLRYGGFLLLATAALLSKAMAVSLPLTLLLFDVWPLGRIGAILRDSRERGQRLAAVLMEKVPLVAMAVPIAFLATVAQKKSGAMAPVGHIAVITIPNAFFSSVLYLYKMIWPTHLSIFYPLRVTPIGPAATIGICTGLVIATLAVIVLVPRRPSFAMGWFWYCLTILPVIGLVQVGEQAMADRYSYVPSIGIAIMAVWAVPSRWVTGPLARTTAAGVALSLVMGLAGLTWVQTGYWRDSFTLFTHSLSVVPGNWQAHNHLALYELKRGRTEEAAGHLRECLRVYSSPGLLMNLGAVLETAERNAEAAEVYAQAARGPLPFADAELRLGNVLVKLDRIEEAILHYRRAIEIEPTNVRARGALAEALARGGRRSG